MNPYATGNPYGIGDLTPRAARARNPFLGTIGDVFSDVGNAVQGAAEAVYGTASDVVQAIPGLRDVVNGPLRDLVNGPLRDFARSPVGEWTLRAIALAFPYTLAAEVGPNIASAVYALQTAVPGMLKGDKFEQAWYDEFARRCNQLIAIAGAEIPGQLSSEVGEGTAYLSKNYPPGEATGSFRDLANNAQIRDEAAAWAMSYYNHVALPDMSMFDSSGHYLGPVATTETRSVQAGATSNLAVRTAAAGLVQSTIFGGMTSTNATVALAKLAATQHPAAPFARAANVIASNAFKAAALKPTVKATGGPVTAKPVSPLLIGGLALGAAAIGFVALRKKKKR